MIKHPSSAGGLGNLKVSSEALLALASNERRQWLREQILQIRWRPGQVMLAGVWLENVKLSPSVQIWIPSKESGAPIIEGIFSQTVKGKHAAFTGASRVQLDDEVTELMVSEATRIASVYQTLGYYGRLSLDSVLVDAPDGSRTLKWIEANARWGGVSIPMTICNRIVGGREPCDFQILQGRNGSLFGDDVSNEDLIHLIPEGEDVQISMRLQASRIGWSEWA